jgi:SAM-dependent methyltransferase
MKVFLVRVFNRIARSFGIPEMQHRIDLVEQTMAKQHDLTLDQLRAMDVFLRNRLNSDYETIVNQLQNEGQLHERRVLDIQEALLRHIEILTDEAQRAVVQHTTAHTETVVSDMRSHIESELAQMRRDITGIRVQAIGPRDASSPQLDNELKQSYGQLIDDSLYAALEDRFRGSRELVQHRQSTYVNFMPKLISISTPAIDLGCGRGEWLEVLRKDGIPAIGVDSNTVAIAECADKGLDVVLGDIFSFLESRESSSVGAVTMFQVLEHMSFPLLVEIFKQVRRVLVPGGVFIAEVPNSLTLRVGASTFWIDPTHERPVHPEVLKFLAQQTGFSTSVGLTLNELEPPPAVIDASQSVIDAISELHHVINGPGDFAIIATA